MIAKEVTQNIMKYYNHGVILVVSNPVDIITYMIQKWSGLPVEKVIGSGTVLDSIRFRYLLSEKLGVDVKNVHGYIIGEHGDSQLPLWSCTHIAGKNINEYIDDPKCNFTEEDKKKSLKMLKLRVQPLSRTKVQHTMVLQFQSTQ